MNKKKLKYDDFGISKKRYKELCGFCEQYPEWKQKLKNQCFIQAVQYNDEPKPSNHNNADTTAKHALLMLKMKKDCELIERVAHMASPEYWESIIKSACYEVSTTYLATWDDLYLSKSAFYERRRYFFYLLDIEKKKIECQNVEKFDCQ